MDNRQHMREVRQMVRLAWLGLMVAGILLILGLAIGWDLSGNAVKVEQERTHQEEAKTERVRVVEENTTERWEAWLLSMVSVTTKGIDAWVLVVLAVLVAGAMPAGMLLGNYLNARRL